MVDLGSFSTRHVEFVCSDGFASSLVTYRVLDLGKTIPSHDCTGTMTSYNDYLDISNQDWSISSITCPWCFNHPNVLFWLHHMPPVTCRNSSLFQLFLPIPVSSFDIDTSNTKINLSRNAKGVVNQASAQVWSWRKHGHSPCGHNTVWSLPTWIYLQSRSNLHHILTCWSYCWHLRTCWSCPYLASPSYHYQQGPLLLTG